MKMLYSFSKHSVNFSYAVLFIFLNPASVLILVANVITAQTTDTEETVYWCEMVNMDEVT